MMELFRKLGSLKRLSSLLASLWTLVILIACFLPGNEIPNVRFPMIDKWVHFIIFAGFSFLWLLVWAPATWRAGLWVFIAAVAFGYAVELLQGSGISPGRAYDANDVLADGIGGLLGVLLFFTLQKMADKQKP